MALDLTGKTAVVTGGATGVGHAIAVALARAGAHVVVGDLRSMPKPGSFDENPDMGVVDMLLAEGRSAKFVTTDVTDVSAIAALAATAIAKSGAIDIWVNNAGVIPEPKSFLDYSDGDLDLCLAVNTKGTWSGMRAAIRQMLTQPTGGAIVNVVSTAGIRAHANQAVYNISKAAAAQATRVAALEYGPNKIRVNAVCPTLIKTALTRPIVEDPRFLQWFSQQATLGAPLDQRQVADAVLFLASDAASAITGVLLPVDMGEALGPLTASLA